MSSANYKNSNSSQKFISLKAASQLFGYTRDHLGLMIRRGKLKAERLGNYYFTTHEWVEDYVKNHASLNHPKLKHKLSNNFRAKLLSSVSKEASSTVNFSRKSMSSISNKPSLSNLSSSFSPAKKVEPLTVKREKAVQPPNPTSSLINSGFQDPHSVILPIRKMDDFTRERILKELDS